MATYGIVSTGSVQYFFDDFQPGSDSGYSTPESSPPGSTSSIDHDYDEDDDNLKSPVKSELSLSFDSLPISINHADGGDGQDGFQQEQNSTSEESVECSKWTLPSQIDGQQQINADESSSDRSAYRLQMERLLRTVSIGSINSRDVARLLSCTSWACCWRAGLR